MTPRQRPKLADSVSMPDIVTPGIVRVPGYLVEDIMPDLAGRKFDKDAIAATPCPDCGAKAGEPCKAAHLIGPGYQGFHAGRIEKGLGISLGAIAK